MIPSRRHVQGAVRMAILLSSLLEVLGRFVPIYVMSRGRVCTARRAAWLHASCARIARRLSLLPSVSGGLEGGGLTVSNHLTYLDILVYGAVRPLVFVAKSEVRRWPLLGTLASLGGTIFVDRGPQPAGDSSQPANRAGFARGISGAAFSGRHQLPRQLGPALSAAAFRTRDPRRRKRYSGGGSLPGGGYSRRPSDLLGRNGLLAPPLPHHVRQGPDSRDQLRFSLPISRPQDRGTGGLATGAVVARGASNSQASKARPGAPTQFRRRGRREGLNICGLLSLQDPRCSW
jgi:Acyltransferase